MRRAFKSRKKGVGRVNRDRERQRQREFTGKIKFAWSTAAELERYFWNRGSTLLSRSFQCQVQEFELDLLKCHLGKGIKPVRIRFAPFWHGGNYYQCLKNML